METFFLTEDSKSKTSHIDKEICNIAEDKLFCMSSILTNEEYNKEFLTLVNHLNEVLI